MKSFFALFTAFALLAGPALQAQATQPGKAAAASTHSASDSSMAWGIALGGLAVIGTVVGIVASSASHSDSFSH